MQGSAGKVSTVHGFAFINAPASTVYQKMTDVTAYKNWNPFVTSVDIQGKLKVGKWMNFSKFPFISWLKYF